MDGLVLDCGTDLVLDIPAACANGEPAQNNLGGLGPDSGVEELRFKGVGQFNGASIDMVFTNTSAYRGPFKGKSVRDKDNKTYNGCLKKEQIATIGLSYGSDTGFLLEFRDSTTNAIVILPGFYFSVLDLDGYEETAEKLVIDGYASYVVTTPSNVIVGEGDCPTTFESCHPKPTDPIAKQCTVPSHEGASCPNATDEGCNPGTDNPRWPHGLLRHQAARSVTFYFQNTGSVPFRIAIGEELYEGKKKNRIVRMSSNSFKRNVRIQLELSSDYAIDEQHLYHQRQLPLGVNAPYHWKRRTKLPTTVQKQKEKQNWKHAHAP